MTPLRSISLLIASCFVIPGASAQKYYPGGLGNAKLFLWLNANKSTSITKSPSNQVSQWNDLSGNGRNFSQATTSLEPTYGTNPSGLVSINYNASNTQYLSLASLPGSLSFTGGISMFAEASYSGTSSNWGWQRIFDFGNGTQSDNFMMGRYGGTQNMYWEGWSGNSGDEVYTSTNPITNAAEGMYEAVQQGGTAGNLTNVSQYLAGTVQTATGQAGSSKTWLPAAMNRTSNFLGRSNWAADNYFTGTMSELLFYNTALNTTQRVIIENYLGTAWNQTVSVKEFTPRSTNTYNTNLVGIGYTSSTDNFLADVVGSTDGLGFSSGTGGSDFLNTAGYVMAAHNAQSATVITPATVSGITSSSTLSRWNRSWLVETAGGNSTGEITLNFNFSDYSGGTFNTSSNYVLLYNQTDGSFASGTNLAIANPVSVTSTNVSFKLPATLLPKGYYTILYSANPIPLPVTLNSFTATGQGNAALLQWSTTQQTAFSGFSIQRSIDGTNFSAIGNVTATAATGDLQQYSFADNTPLPGMNYYRLAMIDQDGTTSWSPIRSVSFASGNAASSVTIYPNPVVSQLHVALTDAAGSAVIRLVNSRGQVMKTTAAVAPVTLDIAMNGLTAGVYFLTVDGANGQHYVREILKD